MTDNRKEGLEDRLKRLGSELSEKRKEDPKYAADEARAAENRKGYQVAVKLSSEFVAGHHRRRTSGLSFGPFCGYRAVGDDHTSPPWFLCRCAERPAFGGHGGSAPSRGSAG